MKVFNFILFLIITSITVSCSNNDDIVFSCDESINQWAKDNLSNLRLMTRSAWIQLDNNKKKAAYRAFSQEQKIQFWKDKICEVKSLDWSEKEIKHIEELENFITNNPDIFAGHRLTDAQANKIDSFFYLWQNSAIEKLGWSTGICIAIAGSGDKILNKYEEIYSRAIIIEEPGDDTPPEENCHCNQTYDFCHPNAWCGESNCNESSSGCGWLLLSSCNGRCK